VVITPSMTYDQLILAASPIAFLPLDGRPTDLTDRHIPTITGSPGSTVLPNGDAAYTFDGVTDYIEIPTADDLSIVTTGQFSVEAWVRPDVLQFTHEDATGYVYVLGKGVADEDEWALRMYSFVTPGQNPQRPNRISFYVWNLTGGDGSGSYFQDVITARTWMYIVATVDLTATSEYPLGSVSLYRDANLRQTTSLTQFETTPAAGTAPARIGTRDVENFFQGAVGKVAVYDRLLTVDEISSRLSTMRL
jgi:Concanavalin A-like lectin/glucanases superfamily